MTGPDTPEPAAAPPCAPIRRPPGNVLSRTLSAMCIGLVRGYQVTLGPLMGGHCRFHPSCSHYSIEAYRTWGPLKGTWLTAKRLARCHPFGGHGFDPVPERKADGVTG